MLRKLFVSAAMAIGVMSAGVTSANAAVIGEASVLLTEGLYTNQNGVQTLQADFEYSNTLPSFDTVARYEASAFLVINNQPVFGDSLDLGITTLNDLIPPGLLEFGALAVDFLLNQPTGTIFFDGTDPDINFDYVFTLESGSDLSSGAGFFQLISNQDYSNELAGLGVTASQATFVAGGALTAFAVPVPAALPLMATGLLIVGFVARRRSA